MLAAASVCAAFSGIATEEQKLIWTRTKLVSFLQGLTNIEPVRIGKKFPGKKTNREIAGKKRNRSNKHKQNLGG